jgi:hypothetical protein
VKTDVELQPADGDNGVATVDLIAALDGNPRFRRDSVLGGVFHPGWISYRELSPVDSMHICIRGDRVSSHVDDVSPLVVRGDGTVRYAWGRVVAHNVAVVLTDLARRARGVQGHQRCDLRCEAVVVEED